MILPRPSVTLHFAQTLDGRIAAAGARTALSTPEGIEHAHRARAGHDAVLVGLRTVVIDDPLLTVRACPGEQPSRVVLASALAIPASARLLDGGASAGPLVIIGAEGRASPADGARLAERGAEVWVVPSDARGRVSLPHALARLRARGVLRLLVEGGAAVLTSFLGERLADRAEIEIAPRMFGDDALAAVGGLGGAPRSSVSLLRPEVSRLGDNVLVRGEVEYPA